jgi:hypothetical protein
MRTFLPSAALGNVDMASRSFEPPCELSMTIQSHTLEMGQLERKAGPLRNEPTSVLADLPTEWVDRSVQASEENRSTAARRRRKKTVLRKEHGRCFDLVPQRKSDRMLWLFWLAIERA